MTTKLQKLFKFSDYWPWALVLSLITLPTIKAITYGHLSAPQWITVGATLLSFWAISAWRFILRNRWINSIFAYTEYGTALYGNIGLNSSYGLITREFDKATEEVMDFWDNRVINQKTITRTLMLNVINGSTLYLSATPIVLHGGQSFTDKIVRGYEQGSQMAIYFDPNDLDTNIRVFKHELGHLCLASISIMDETESHRVMNQYGFNF